MRTRLRAYTECLLADPYSGTPHDVLARYGLHWNRLTPDDRTRSTEVIRTLPFRAFVAYAPLRQEDRDTYERVYSSLLTRVLETRFLKYDRCRVEIKVEQNSKIRSGTLKRVVSAIAEDLHRRGSRRPDAVEIHVAKKNTDDALPLPDLVLGVFSDYAKSAHVATKAPGERKKTAPGAQADARFEMIRDRLRAIYSLESGSVYSRKNKFTPW